MTLRYLPTFKDVVANYLRQNGPSAARVVAEDLEKNISFIIKILQGNPAIFRIVEKNAKLSPAIWDVRNGETDTEVVVQYRSWKHGEVKEKIIEYLSKHGSSIVSEIAVGIGGTVDQVIQATKRNPGIFRIVNYQKLAKGKAAVWALEKEQCGEAK